MYIFWIRIRKLGVINLVCLLSGCIKESPVPLSSVWTRVQLDYSVSGITPNGSTVLFFSTDCNREPVILRTHNMSDSILLPEGSYSALAFNETELDHDGMFFRNLYNYTECEAVLDTQAVPAGFTYPVSGSLVDEPDTLAIDRVEQFSVTLGNNGLCNPLTVMFVPTPVISQIIVTIHIKGINNLAIQRNYALLSGLAEGYNFSRGMASNASASHLFLANNRFYNPFSMTDGVIRTTFLSFGLASPTTRAAVPSQLVLWLRLRNGTSYPVVSREVTGRFISEPGTKQSRLYLEVGLGNDPDDPFIVLPDVPDSGGSGGFDTHVDDWGDENIVDVPV